VHDRDHESDPGRPEAFDRSASSSTSEDLYQAQTSLENSASLQSVAEEVLDREAAEAVLRELNKLCAFKLI